MGAIISIRDYRLTDRKWVTDSFLHTFGPSAYGEGYDAQFIIDLIDPLLITWNISVAVSEDDDNEVYGWICYKQPNQVAWIFTKGAFRKIGVAKALLKHSGLDTNLRALFVATKSPDRSMSFYDFMKAHGYTIRFRPYDYISECGLTAIGS
jgi:hypothetical protein